MPRTPRATKAEHAKRIEAVRQLLLRGTSRARIVQIVATMWGTATRQADGYIADATEQIAATVREHLPRALEHATARRLEMMARAQTDGDARLAHDIDKDLAKLLGLYPPVGVRVFDWRDEWAALIREGKATPEDVEKALDGDMAQELFRYIGLVRVAQDQDAAP